MGQTVMVIHAKTSDRTNPTLRALRPLKCMQYMIPNANMLPRIYFLSPKIL